MFGIGLAKVLEIKKGDKAKAKIITIPGNINHLNSCDFFMAYPRSERKLLLGLEMCFEIKPTLNIQFGAVEGAATGDFVRVVTSGHEWTRPVIPGSCDIEFVQVRSA